MDVDHAIRRIRAFARTKGWRKSRLAAEAGMQDTVLRNFDRDDWNPTADTLRRLGALVPTDFDPGPDPAPPNTASKAA